MATYEIVGTTTAVNFAPASAVEEVLQNVRTLMATAKFTAPLDRALGLKTSLVDRPLPQAKALLGAEIIQAVRRYEPRAKVEKVTFSGDAEGRLIPKALVSVDE